MANKNMRIIDLLMKVPSIEVKPLLLKLLNIKRSILIAVLVIVAIPSVMLTYGFFHLVGTQKVYCLNCHVNTRNVDFWRSSKVHPNISCASCHDVDKGLWNAAFHFSFSAKDDVISGHCNDCHVKTLDAPVGIEAAKKTRADNELIRIPHAKHIKELGIKCTYCHFNVFHDRRPAKFSTNRPTMDVCYTCHDEKTTACDSCHPAGMPTTVSMSGKVGGGKIGYEMKGAGPVTFDHKKHAAIGCEGCHPKVFKMQRTSGQITMARMYAGKDCGHCHNGKGAFASTKCEGCHQGGAQGGGDITYPGGGSGKVVFKHSRHMKKFKCEDCHTKMFGYTKTVGKMTMAGMTAGKTCGGCHNGKKAFASDDCTKCHAM
ncbi:MAG TPA: c(7)-type cytochrome triheme domain-containing protein [Nitrospirota bacterium]